MGLRSWKCKNLCFLTAFLLLLLFIATSITALASGKGHHHPEDEMSEHMKSMQAVKEGIPEEYQIMERSPILPGEESLQSGRKLFLQNCAVCHGDKGDGKGPAAAALKTPPANFLDSKHSSIYGPGEKYWIISNGSGSTGMPSFTQLTSIQRWNLVNHILQLQQSVQ